jgi:hypothetical protein
VSSGVHFKLTLQSYEGHQIWPLLSAPNPS